MGPQQSSTPPAHERAGIRGGARTRSHNRSQSISRKRYRSRSKSRSKYGGKPEAQFSMGTFIAETGNKPPSNIPPGTRGGKTKRSKSRTRSRKGGCSFDQCMKDLNGDARTCQICM